MILIFRLLFIIIINWTNSTFNDKGNTMKRCWFTLSFFSIMIIFTTVLFAEEKDRSFKVMSFNIRLNTSVDKENAWPNRKEVLAAEIKENAPVLFGVQEAKWEQMEYLTKAFSDYGTIGVGRDDGARGGEFSAVFYKKSTFELLESGTFWLSETPEKAGSLGWDAACRRVVSWGKFKCKATPKTLLYANTHFDHIGKKARHESALMMIKRLPEMAKGCPVIVSGDFNSDTDSEVYKIITGGLDGIEGFVDTNPAAKCRDLGSGSTFQSFGKYSGKRIIVIDYIFVSKGIEVQKFKICPEKRNGRFCSDHNGIVATIALP